MPAPKGNNYWMNVECPGRPKSYTPETLWAKAMEFFSDCENNPWYKVEAVKGGDNAGMLINVPTSRPFTISGLCVFAGIVVQTFDNYSKSDEFLEVTTRIREIIFTQKFEGAAVGAFHANLISRDLHLVDQKKILQEEQPKQITGFKIVRKEESNAG
jgi:hypothetical protein